MLSNDGAATTGDAIFSAGAERIIEAGRILVFIGCGTAAASLTSSTADSLQQSASRLVPSSMSASERALSTFFDSSRHRRSTTVHLDVMVGACMLCCLWFRRHGGQSCSNRLGADMDKRQRARCGGRPDVSPRCTGGAAWCATVGRDERGWPGGRGRARRPTRVALEAVHVIFLCRLAPFSIFITLLPVPLSLSYPTLVSNLTTLEGL